MVIFSKEYVDMKKAIALFSLTVLVLCLAGCNRKPVKIDFPFDVEDVENIEMYHSAGVPVIVEKKVVTAESDISALYEMFEGLSLIDKEIEETAGADVTSFRFNLSDGTSYELIYVSGGVKRGNLKSETGGFVYFTSADIGAYWYDLNRALKAAPVNESELPSFT